MRGIDILAALVFACIKYGDSSPISQFGSGWLSFRPPGPAPGRHDPHHGPHKEEYVGYLATFFYSEPLAVMMALSNGNSPTSFQVLNNNQSILQATGGQKAVRDPHIIAGMGPEAGRKWYVVTTDQDSNTQPSWNWAESNGSKSINVWDSANAARWDNYRNVRVEDDTAGMTWAPDAIWDPEKGEYFVYWSSRLFAPNDTSHNGPATPVMIRASHTKDFITFDQPFTYVQGPNGDDVIDLFILHAGGQTFYRFMKDDTLKNTFFEYSTTGLFGTWVRLGGEGAYIEHHVEGPAAFYDNQDPTLVHLWLDDYNGLDGYHPWQSSMLDNQTKWTRSDETGFPTGMHHGKVIPVTQATYDLIEATWGSS